MSSDNTVLALRIDDSVYALEHSQYSEDEGMYPFHISTLAKVLEGNLTDFFHNNRGSNKWQIIFIGDHESCIKLLREYEKQRGI